MLASVIKQGHGWASMGCKQGHSNGPGGWEVVGWGEGRGERRNMTRGGGGNDEAQTAEKELCFQMMHMGQAVIFAVNRHPQQSASNSMHGERRHGASDVGGRDAGVRLGACSRPVCIAVLSD